MRYEENGIVWLEFDSGHQVSYHKSDPIIKKDGLVFRDIDKSGKLEVFKDWRNSPEERAQSLSQRLPIEMIAGLMLHSHHQTVLEGETKYEKLFGKNTYDGEPFQEGVNYAYELTDQQKELIEDNHVRHVLLSSVKSSLDAARWQNNLQYLASQQEWGIPVCISSDPRHGLKADAEYNLGSGSDVSTWPENIGIASSKSKEIAFNFGKTMSEEYRAMGISMFLGPQIDIATDPRWSRIAGTFGESPELSAELAKFFIDGCQSTYNEQGEDLGWGMKSVSTIVKHWPGGGSGEGGRDAHYNYGKYAVYPGNNFDQHLIPFLEGAFKLNGKTKIASGVMPYYTISYDQDPSKENVGNGFSKYIVKDLLRDKYKYDGLVCSDWMITKDEGPFVETFSGKCWGVEELSETERHLKILLSGVDQFGGNSQITPVLEAYHLGIIDFGEAFMDTLFRGCAYRILLNLFRLGLFDSPYVRLEIVKKIVGNSKFVKLGEEAQRKSLVLLKNQNQILPINKRKKIYIPEITTRSSVDWFGNIVSGKKNKALDSKIVNKYFEEVSSPKDCDFCVVFIESPRSNGYSKEDGYIPISLQYRPYHAKNAREISIAGGDPLESFVNRSYKKKLSKTQNFYELDTVLEVKQQLKNKPLIVVVDMKKPIILSEFEDKASSIIANFGSNKEIVLQMIKGLFNPEATLPYQLPKDMGSVESQLEDVPFDLDCYQTSDGNLLDFGFGLSYKFLS